MLNRFVSSLTSKDIARKNRYRIDIFGNGPQAAGGFRTDMATMCETIEFPGQNMMSSADTLRFGPQREFINGVTYGPVTASFIMSPDMYIKRFFERWQQQTMNMTTWEPKYYADYIGGMKIYQLDRLDRVTYVVELFEVYPKTITAQDLGNASSDAYQTLSVELDYHHWKYSNETSPGVGRSGSSSVTGGISFAVSTAGQGHPGNRTGDATERGTVQRNPHTEAEGEAEAEPGMGGMGGWT